MKILCYKKLGVFEFGFGRKDRRTPRSAAENKKRDNAGGNTTFRPRNRPGCVAINAACLYGSFASNKSTMYPCRPSVVTNHRSVATVFLTITMTINTYFYFFATNGWMDRYLGLCHDVLCHAISMLRGVRSSAGVFRGPSRRPLRTTSRWRPPPRFR